MLGEFVLPNGEPVWTAALVRALGGLGIEEKASRQAMARAAAEGWIAGAREGRRARWELTAPGRRLLADGRRADLLLRRRGPAMGRALGRPDGHGPRDPTTASPPAAHETVMGGFWYPAPGMWVSTNTAREAEADQIVRDLGLDDAAFSFIGPFGGIGSARGLVDQAWNLGAVADHYRVFLAGFDGLTPASGDEAMLTQIRLVHEWRRFPFLDPQLPADCYFRPLDR